MRSPCLEELSLSSQREGFSRNTPDKPYSILLFSLSLEQSGMTSMFPYNETDWVLVTLLGGKSVLSSVRFQLRKTSPVGSLLLDQKGKPFWGRPLLDWKEYVSSSPLVKLGQAYRGMRFSSSALKRDLVSVLFEQIARQH